MGDLEQIIIELGAYNAARIAVKDITFDRSFRTLCESNACGNYGKSYMCPPDAGDIDLLIAKAKSYDYAIVYQTVGILEDSYDFEGMMAAGQHLNELAQGVSSSFSASPFSNTMNLGSGGCRVCEMCAKREDVPCRYPDKALSSLETYGVNVLELAVLSGMKYINGQNTVTYFGAFFYSE